MTPSAPARLASVVRPWLPRQLRAHRILSGPIRGARIVTSWHDYPAGIAGITERPLIDWFAQNVKAGETWLDVGAHYGYTAIALSQLVGRTGRVFAFEPMLATVECITKMRALNRLDQLTVVPRGLGSPDTTVHVSVPSIRGMADKTLTGTQSAQTESIEVARFDWLWPQINGGHAAIHGIKIDVQGMELETLEGMKDLLSRERPRLVVEVHRGVRRDVLLDLLQSAGYSRPVAIEPAPGEHEAMLLDDRSYAFLPARARADL